MISIGIGLRFSAAGLVCSADSRTPAELIITFPEGPELPVCRSCAVFLAKALTARLLDILPPAPATDEETGK